MSSRSLHPSSSSVELLGADSNQFTAQQLANFKQAFGVFDVNKDGRISTQEIFEVLTTMGNTVSQERENKIRGAVDAVDKDGSGNLDFHQFIQFMQIMDRHNKLEAQSASDAGYDLGGKPEGPIKYAKFCCNVDVRSNPSINCACAWFVYLISLALLVHSVGVAVYIAIGDSFWEQNPTDTNDNDAGNHWGQVVRYVRYANYFNFLTLLLFLTDSNKINGIRSVLQSYSFPASPSTGNVLKFVVRRTFLLNVIANIFLILGHPNFGWNLEFIRDNWQFFWIPAAQIVGTFLVYSPLLYFDTTYVPEACCDWIKVMLIDFFPLNLLRMINGVVKNVVFGLIFLPALLVYTVVLLFSCCCCRSLFNFEDDQSKTVRFLRLSAFWASDEL